LGKSLKPFQLSYLCCLEKRHQVTDSIRLTVTHPYCQGENTGLHAVFEKGENYIVVTERELNWQIVLLWMGSVFSER